MITVLMFYRFNLCPALPTEDISKRACEQKNRPARRTAAAPIGRPGRWSRQLGTSPVPSSLLLCANRAGCAQADLIDSQTTAMVLLPPLLAQQIAFVGRRACLEWNGGTQQAFHHMITTATGTITTCSS